jgi:hypothetical protein
VARSQGSGGIRYRLQYRHTTWTRISTSVTIGPSLTGLRGTQLTDSIIYTLVSQKLSCAPLCIIPPGKRHCRVIKYRLMCGFLHHQGLSSCGLRHGDLHQVACWIRSSSSGDVHCIIGRFLYGLTRCETLGQTYRIISLILIMWYQITGFITTSIFGWLLCGFFFRHFSYQIVLHWNSRVHPSSTLKASVQIAIYQSIHVFRIADCFSSEVVRSAASTCWCWVDCSSYQSQATSTSSSLESRQARAHSKGGGEA